ncbi:MAG: glutathione S-transferase [Caulobacteraceae bacterium]|nr:glutathione S-transferase [Caulobacteraceae bacterium]
MSDAIHAAGLWTGLCILLLLVLSGLTSANRRKHKVSIGDGGKAEVAAASRAFGNAAEYMPIALIGLALMALTGFQPLWIHAVGGSFFLGRVMHAWGMFVTREGKPPAIQRMIGMLLTYVPLLAAAGALVWCFVCGR